LTALVGGVQPDNAVLAELLRGTIKQAHRRLHLLCMEDPAVFINMESAGQADRAANRDASLALFNAVVDSRRPLAAS
jgi:hypothetical protein